MTHIKQLDSLRAIAVTLVIFSHWCTPDKTSYYNHWHGVIGPLGVDIFFVLSGFLITKILLEQRFKKNEFETTNSQLQLVQRFYIRRILRIFPIYYLFLLLISIYDLYIFGTLKYEMGFYYTYTSNYYQYFDNPENMTLGHLWSLAAEEQFYLIWPWLMLFVPQSKILRVIILFIFVGVISQYLLHSVYNHRYMTICCFDAFGAGALLAWIAISKEHLLKKVEKISMYGAIIAILLIAFGILFPDFNVVPLRVKNTFIAFYLIVFLYQNQNNSFKWSLLFNNSALIYIGKISYGIYLFHMSIPHIWNYIPVRITQELPVILIWVLNALMLIAVASASYYIIEKPFLKLKKYYN
ncbi:acyltransferase family protein [Cytophaga aurantiaca]|uniref:acyltransferase family protein n=1 Tax=Cytophaga aurantiaca TaxID=29530 RepID=UPI000369F03F|nr:acyltransferase [Cytophaga aurantiaca]